ncbi:hypothetical protein BDV96DRAFT_677031 [Lophiotrema nucula]|uniref:Uncharacterized protein n=1 Tax=Lophiotrema nucula TaxID=690887 RepID=A0A6A5YFT7_9PLEO|nr:hypothetical protein BDV96DRAFT_677031 [Lophiotrema nucula]
MCYSRDPQIRAWGVQSATTFKRMIALCEKLEQAFQAYGRACNRAFCDQVLNALPRQIRDLIYPHVFDRDSFRVDHCHRYFAQLPKPASVTFFDTGAWKTQLEGHAIWPELAESWYHTRLFVFDGCWGNEQLWDLLVNDKWNTGLEPQKLLKNMKVYLKRIHLFPDEHLQHKGEEMRPRDIDMILQQLWFLTHIETQNVKIEIHAYSNHTKEGELNTPVLKQQFDLMFPALCQMKDKGWNVCVSAWIDSDRWLFTPTTGKFAPDGWIDWMQQQREERYGIRPIVV